MDQSDKAPPASDGDSRAGFVLAVLSYFLWGFLPLYLRLLDGVPPTEIVAHRILWSLPVAGAALVVVGRSAALRAALTDPRLLAQAALTAVLISLNWGIYVWAIAAGRALDTAFGYYINPLFSVAMGALVLGERLGRAQLAAIGLAAAAVALLTWETGSLPWVALLLMLSWGFYAFFRKTPPIGPNQGFFLEILLLCPFALGYAVWLGATGQGHFLAGNARETWLLVGCGLVTATPLLIYANSAKLLRLSTIGMLQYIAPTLVFLIAVLVFREPFPPARLVAFGLIWAAVALFVAASLRGSGRGVRGG